MFYIRTILGLRTTFYEKKSSKTIRGLVCGLWKAVLLVFSHSHGYRIMKQEASVEFCTTFDMIGDYFKKALQGSQFRRFRNIILGIHEDDIPSYNASGRALLE